MAISGASSLLHTGRFEHHLITRKQKKGGVKKALVTGLMLTSLVDMFSMLVCFLLQTFSSSPEVFVANEVKLPEAFSGAIVKEAPVLSISRSKVFLDSKDLGDLHSLLKQPAKLQKGLIQFKQSWAKQNPTKAFPGEINLQADRAVSSQEVAKMMGLLNAQSYDVIQLAVMGRN
jgi:biopolymer transport protein ExbD